MYVETKVVWAVNDVPGDDALVNDVFGSRLDDLLHEAKRKEAIAMMCYLDNESHARGW